MTRRTRIAISALVAVALVIVAACGLYALANSRTYQLFGDLVHRIDTDVKAVALTLDDGPSDRTPEVLRVLAEAGVPATFYVTGTELSAHPDMGRAIVEAGHELGNHTFTHRRMVLVGGDTVREEIESTDKRIRAAGFDGDITFRPPYGKKLVALPRYLGAHDRTTVMWDVEPDSAAAEPSAMVDAVLAQTRPGSIILLHAMYPARQSSLDAIPGIVAGLRAEGYRFVTMSELLELRR